MQLSCSVLLPPAGDVLARAEKAFYPCPLGCDMDGWRCNRCLHFLACAAGRDASRVTLQVSVSFPVGAERQQSFSYVGRVWWMGVAAECALLA